MQILGISGSIRSGSYNRALLVAAAGLMPDGDHLVIEGLQKIPLYDDELAKEGPPGAVIAFREHIAQSDGLLIASPEYNYSISGVLKNALDWAGTDTLGNLLAEKITAIMGASRSIFGTVRAQLHLRQVLQAANANVIRKPEVYIPKAQDVITGDGTIHDERTLEKIRTLLEALIAELSAHP
jgi:chromate reductase